MKPYYERGGMTIYHGDCKDVLSHLDPESIELVLTDPPYNVGKYFGEGVDDNRPESDYWADYRTVFAQVFPLMADNTLIYVSSTTKQMYEVKPRLEEIGWRWLQTLIWYRPNMIKGTKTFASPWSQLYEPITLLVKGKRPKMGNQHQHREHKTHDVLTYASPQSNFRESVEHPTQKPLGLYKAIIGRSNARGGIVLDPFMGSGTSLRAGKDLGHRAIGIEIEERHCETAATRLSQEVFNEPGQTLVMTEPMREVRL